MKRGNAFGRALIVFPMLFLASAPSAHAEGEAAAVGITCLSGLSVIGSGIRDIVAAPSSARKYNASLQSGLRSDENPIYASSSSAEYLDLSSSARVQTFQISEIGAPADLNRQPISPRKALYWSLGGTLVPTVAGSAIMLKSGGNDNQPLLATGIVIASLGWIIGPSAGHWYSKQNSRAWKGCGIRLGLAALGATIIVLAAPSLGD